MKSFFFLIIIQVISITTNAQSAPKLGGLWKTDRGVLVRFEHSGSSLIARYINKGDCVTGHGCILQSAPEFYVRGSLSGQKMELTMMRCTHDSAMRADGLSDHYTRPCKVNSFDADHISGTYLSEYYDVELKDGKKHFTRNASGDEDRPFSIARTNCRKELEELVQELLRRKEAIKDIKSVIGEVNSNADNSTQGWYREVGDQLGEDVFQTVVPFPFKCQPDFSIGCLADNIDQYAERVGNWTLGKATKIVGLYDLLIDWMNVLGKGKTTLDELDQIYEELQDMNENEVSNFKAFVDALKEYEALSKECENEIPKDQQPKLPKESNPETESMGSSHKEAQRVLGNIQSDITGTSQQLNRTVTSLNTVKGYLERYKDADPNKSVSELLDVNGFEHLNKGMKNFLQNLVTTLRALVQLENRRTELVK